MHKLEVCKTCNGELLKARINRSWGKYTEMLAPINFTSLVIFRKEITIPVQRIKKIEGPPSKGKTGFKSDTCCMAIRWRCSRKARKYSEFRWFLSQFDESSWRRRCRSRNIRRPTHAHRTWPYAKPTVFPELLLIPALWWEYPPVKKTNLTISLKNEKWEKSHQ
jgi:hypothetical protein